MWTDTGTPTFELAGHETSDTASDHVIDVQTLKKDKDRCDVAFQAEVAVTHGNAI